MLQAVTNGYFPIVGVKNMEVSLNKISDAVNMGKGNQIVANVGILSANMPNEKYYVVSVVGLSSAQIARNGLIVV